MDDESHRRRGEKGGSDDAARHARGEEDSTGTVPVLRPRRRQLPGRLGDVLRLRERNLRPAAEECHHRRGSRAGVLLVLEAVLCWPDVVGLRSDDPDREQKESEELQTRRHQFSSNEASSSAAYDYVFAPKAAK